MPYVIANELIDDARRYIEHVGGAAERMPAAVDLVSRLAHAEAADVLAREDAVAILRESGGADVMQALAAHFGISDEELEPHVTFEVPESVAHALQEFVSAPGRAPSSPSTARALVAKVLEGEVPTDVEEPEESATAVRPGWPTVSESPPRIPGTGKDHDRSGIIKSRVPRS